MSHYYAWNAQGINQDAGLGLTPEEVREQVKALQDHARVREAEFAENRRKSVERQLREVEEQRQRVEDSIMTQELTDALEEARSQSWKAWRERNYPKIDALVPFTHGTKTNQWE